MRQIHNVGVVLQRNSFFDSGSSCAFLMQDEYLLNWLKSAVIHATDCWTFIFDYKLSIILTYLDRESHCLKSLAKISFRPV